MGPNGGGKSVVVRARAPPACRGLLHEVMNMRTPSSWNGVPTLSIQLHAPLRPLPCMHAACGAMRARPRRAAARVQTAQGEAIAFALGGTRSMLRAKSLAALINQAATREDGAGSATVRGGGAVQHARPGMQCGRQRAHGHERANAAGAMSACTATCERQACMHGRCCPIALHARTRPLPAHRSRCTLAMRPPAAAAQAARPPARRCCLCAARCAPTAAR